MIMDKARSVDLRNQTLGEEKAETLHGCGHGSSVSTIIEPTAIHLTQDPTTMQGVTPCITQGNTKTGLPGTKAVAALGTMTDQQTDWESENREHLPIH